MPQLLKEESAPITADEVRRLLSYDPETGVMTWKARGLASWDARFAGKKAGGLRDGGYLAVSLFNNSYRFHRIVWLWVTGEFPKGEIDHLDHNRQNNAWHNLRTVSRAENQRNHSMRRDNTTGVTGVSWDKNDRRWDVQIRVNGRKKHLGKFASFEKAVAVRRAADAEHNFHLNHGLKTQKTTDTTCD